MVFLHQCLVYVPAGTVQRYIGSRGQMGTERTLELQKAIESLIARVGWSRKALARQLHWELNDTDDDEELKRFEERLKKELTRGKERRLSLFSLGLRYLQRRLSTGRRLICSLSLIADPPASSKSVVH